MAREDAYSWDGDDDPTLSVSPAGDGADAVSPETDDASTAQPVGAESRRIDTGKVVASSTDVGTPVTKPSSTTSAANAESAQLGNAALIGLGLLGGIYLFWTIGWFISAERIRTRTELSGGIVDPMTNVSGWVAVAAPAIWFLTVWVLTRRAPVWQRILWLIGGVIVLLPWPFVMIGAIGV